MLTNRWVEIIPSLEIKQLIAKEDGVTVFVSFTTRNGNCPDCQRKDMNNDTQEFIEGLKRRPDIVGIILFGSWARGIIA